MKKTTLFSLAAAAVLFTACGEETKKVVEEINKTKVAEAVKTDTQSAVESAKVKASEIAETAKTESEKMAAVAAEKAEKAKDIAQVKVAEAAAAVEEKAAALKEAATPAVPVAPDAYAKCKGCHGPDGKTKALGKSAIIAGQDKAALIASMNEYKAGTKNVAGMGMLMKGQVESMSDEEIEAVAEYLSSIQ